MKKSSIPHLTKPANLISKRHTREAWSNAIDNKDPFLGSAIMLPRHLSDTAYNKVRVDGRFAKDIHGKANCDYAYANKEVCAFEEYDTTIQAEGRSSRRCSNCLLIKSQRRSARHGR